MDRLGQGPSILATPTSPLGELQESLCEWLISSPRVTRLIADIAQDVNGSWALLMPLSDALPAVHSLGVCAQHRSRLQPASRRGPIAPFLQMRNAVFCSILAALQDDVIERIATLEAAQNDTVRLFEQIYIRQQQLSKQCRKDATKFGQV